MRRDKVEEKIVSTFIDLCEGFVDLLENSPAYLKVSYDVDYVSVAQTDISFNEEGLVVKGMLFSAKSYGGDYNFTGAFTRAKKAASDRLHLEQRTGFLRVLENAKEELNSTRKELED